ncbi:MAG TPA: N-acetyltransferase [Planctomycetaceae bacterium]|nr:N-acetyltransferase [Planctomycetaceae bacterium]
MPAEEIQIDLAVQDDLPAINDIYNYYVDHSTATFQEVHETLEDRDRWFTQHGPRHPVVVARRSGSVVGWASLSEWNSRSAYSQTGEVSVYIHHEHHRLGIGRRLLEEVIERARGLGFHTLIGGACTEQTASIGLQESLGFHEVADFRAVGYKFERWLDVKYFQLML